jgi:PAS domain S-box-containing protein
MIRACSKDETAFEKILQVISETQRDLVECKQAEENLRRVHTDLETGISLRTADLQRANEQLQKEIAERKRAEETLIEERNLLRALIDTIPDYIYAKNTNSQFILVNRASVHYLGAKTAEEVIGKTDFDFFLGEPVERYFADEKVIYQTGQPSIGQEHPIMTESGKMGWFSITKVPFRDSEGKIVGLVGISRDISELKFTEEKLRKQNEYLAALHETTLGLINRLELTDLLEVIIRRASALMDSTDGFIYQVEPEENAMIEKVGVGIWESKIGFRVKSNQGIVGKVWQTGQPVIVENYSTWSERLPDPEFDNLRAVAGVPLKSGRKVVGMIGLGYTHEERTFGEDKILLLNRFAELVSIALDNARLYTSLQQELAGRKRVEEALRKAHEELEIRVHERTVELQHANEQLKSEIAERKRIEEKMFVQNTYMSVLHETSLGLMNRLDLSDLLDAIITHAAAFLGTPHGFIHLFDSEKDEMVAKKGIGVWKDLLGLRIKFGEGLVGKIWQTGQPLIVKNYSNWPGRALEPKYDVLRAVVGVPLKLGQRMVGVIGLSHIEETRTFEEEDIKLLRGFAELASIALDNAQLYTSVQQELKERKRAEEALRRAHDELELRVKERTVDLQRTNEQLQNEITERKRAEDSLRLVLKDLAIKAADLASVNEDLSQFAYVVSHDIKAPLRAIHNYADFLREDLETTLEGDQRDYLDGMSRAVKQAEELVEDLLEFSRVGRQDTTLTEVNLGAFLRELIDSFSLPADVEVRIEKEWPTISVGLVLLRQIFQNLILNGIKFNHSSPKILELGWRPAEEDKYEVFIRDNGIGIDPRYHDQIFRIFQRLHTNREFEGTGIGLAIVKKAASKLQGSIRLESKLGEGSTFFVTLPKTQIKEEENS